MRNLKYRFFGYFFAIIVSIVYLVYRYFILENASDFHKEILVTTAIGFIMTAVVGIYEIAKNNGKYFWLTVKCWLFIPKKIVYVSLSYLIRIKLSGTERYLLVKGSKINQYQPVGGVYKLVGNKDIYKDWQASIKPDAKNPKDLRFFIKAKYLPDVLKWFKSSKDREVGVWREFQEELIDSGILKSENFKSIRAEYLYSRENLLSKQTRFKNETYHALVYNVFNIELSEEQVQEVINLEKNKLFTKKYAFVTEDDISKECFNNSKIRIGQHTKHII
ncbi:hypothetical protein MWU78_09230 [Arenibacter sp. F26102]|uniref:SMODS-associated NUDIX domain-containing protein n=1 Tax=Arenibacter sp. F26102 TaxID=2926416 RepID=UPI001FF61001|nr:hypothetical protein [Arenibacter sp. F26102]MCK0145824.1 hypothetical protein [Arenibacter sp. F26102]